MEFWGFVKLAVVQEWNGLFEVWFNPKTREEWRVRVPQGSNAV